MGIFFLRHLKTFYNQNGLISGSADCDILPNQSISNLKIIEEAFDITFCSTLMRCRSTLNLIPNEKLTVIKFTDDLVERNMGILEGLKREIAREKFPHLFADKKVDVAASIPQGESIIDVKNRISSVAEFINTNVTIQTP